MKKFSVLALLAFIACHSAAADYDNHYDRCHRLYGFVDGLYWRAYEDGLDYAIGNNNGAVHIDTNGSAHRVDFDRTGGFRVGAAYEHEGRKQGFMAYWTRFGTNGADCIEETFPTVLFPVWTNPGSMLTSQQNARACVDLDLDMLDAHLFAQFQPNCSLEVMPMLGVAYARIDQVFNINANGGQSQGPVATVLDDSIKMCNDFWGVGPKVGIRSFWHLAYGVHMLGHFDVTLMYGRFNIRQHESIEFSNEVDPTTFLDIVCNRFHMCRPRLDLMLGLAWQTDLNACCAFDVQVAWEQLYFFGQNQLMRFFDDVNPGINMSVNGDLALQGLTVRVGLGF